MSNGERDKLGEKLHDVEAARENEWARKRDQELLEKLREAAHDNEAARRRDQASLEKLHNQPASVAICPECQEELVANTDASVGGWSARNNTEPGSGGVPSSRSWISSPTRRSSSDVSFEAAYRRRALAPRSSFDQPSAYHRPWCRLSRARDTIRPRPIVDLQANLI